MQTDQFALSDNEFAVYYGQAPSEDLVKYRVWLISVSSVLSRSPTASLSLLNEYAGWMEHQPFDKVVNLNSFVRGLNYLFFLIASSTINRSPAVGKCCSAWTTQIKDSIKLKNYYVTKV